MELGAQAGYNTQQLERTGVSDDLANGKIRGTDAAGRVGGCSELACIGMNES